MSEMLRDGMSAQRNLGMPTDPIPESCAPFTQLWQAHCLYFLRYMRTGQKPKNLRTHIETSGIIRSLIATNLTSQFCLRSDVYFVSSLIDDSRSACCKKGQTWGHGLQKMT
jgi:uncharacterized protein (DUF2236 family)